MLRVITLFSGYDSQCLALNRLGIEYELVRWCEIDKASIQAHNTLFPQYADRNLGDISQVDWSSIPTPIDLLTYSSPCQDFSVAGLQRGGEKGSGTRSSLLWECEKAIETLKPKYLLFENVPAVISDKFKPNFIQWIKTLGSLGYRNYYQLLNAKHYGVPQNRNRLFMVSILGNNQPSHYYFPKPFKLERRLKDVLEQDVPENYYLSYDRIQGLLDSTRKEEEAGRGFAFYPKDGSEDYASSVTTKAGGRKTENFIIEPQIEVICELNKDNRRPKSGSIRQQDYVIGTNGVSMTIPSSQYKHPFKIAEPNIEIVGNLQPDNNWQGSVVRQQNQVIGSEGISPAITGLHNNHAFKIAEQYDNEPQIAAMRGRSEGDSHESKNVQKLEIGDSDTSNTITSVAKDNLLLEPQVLGWSRDDHGNIVNRHPVDVANCVCCAKRENTQNYVVENGHKHHQQDDIQSEEGLSRTLVVGSHGNSSHFTKTAVSTPAGLRIRRLTERELFRLMDVEEKDIDILLNAGISKTQLAKMAGNSIVVAVLYHILNSLLVDTQPQHEQQLMLF